MGQTEYKFRTVERSNQELPDEEVQEDVEEQAVMIRVRLVLMIQQQGRKEATNDEVSIIFSDRPPRFRRTHSPSAHPPSSRYPPGSTGSRLLQLQVEPGD